MLSSANSESMTSFFLICIPSISFYYLTALGRTSSLYWIDMESGQRCLVPDFSGIALSISPFSLMLTVDLLYIAFVMFRYVPYIPYIPVPYISPRPLSWRDIVFCPRLFQHLMRWSSVFVFQFVCMVDYINRFSYVEPSLDHWDEVYLVMVDGFSDVFLDSVFQYFIEYFCICVH